MRIGFQLPGDEEVEPEVGAADPDDAGPPFHEGLFDFMLEHYLLRFATVYGSYAAVRDLLESIF
ncbi:MAG: hypothetical protein HOK35_10350 [Cytophagia bacterium]|nr:hypothetical protein [Cytophagia bacterium]